MHFSNQEADQENATGGKSTKPSKTIVYIHLQVIPIKPLILYRNKSKFSNPLCFFQAKRRVVQEESVESNRKTSYTIPHTFPDAKFFEDEVFEEIIKAAKDREFMLALIYSFVSP